uniref:Flavin-containing monooxygenase n=2 Tax=Panagrolaimus sp. JU765 TaxID=591449 RepID=A0AC34RHW8_9BILA
MIDLRVLKSCAKAAETPQPNPAEDEGTVMFSTVINTSKEMTAYSDFPPPADFPNYMHNRQMLAYFRLYADHFDLKKHIRFEHEVLTIERALDFDSTGQWDVTYRNIPDDEVYRDNRQCQSRQQQTFCPTTPPHFASLLRVLHGKPR